MRLRWAYGVMTVPERKDCLLPRTLTSLARSGFDRPRLFVDDCDQEMWKWYQDRFGLEVTPRWPRIRVAANWELGMRELFCRNPAANRFALFQDDLVCSLNLRSYLERATIQSLAYWNLYTSPSNESYATDQGWFQARPLNSDPSNGLQTGRGAVALVFSFEGLIALFSSEHLAIRPADVARGHRAIDGGIVTAMNKAGWREWVHMPSLVQHTGLISSMGNRPHKQSASFMGEDFDLLVLDRPCPEP